MLRFTCDILQITDYILVCVLHIGVLCVPVKSLVVMKFELPLYMCLLSASLAAACENGWVSGGEGGGGVR